MIIVTIGVCLATLITGPAATSPTPDTASQLAGEHLASPDSLATSTSDAVVTIRSGQNAGTGFVIGPGEIVTAAHVVDVGVDTVVHVGGQRLEAQLVAFDPAVDLALLSVSATDLPSLQIASSLPSVGDDAMAFSAADGVVAATRGIVSTYETVRGVPHLRTDAAVNSGSSGGPIVDGAGNVIGVTVTKAEGREGVAHAVTADVLQTFLQNRPTAAATPSPVEDRSSSTLPLIVGGSVLILAVPLIVLLRRRGRTPASQPTDDIQLGRSRIRLDADAAFHPRTGEADDA